MGMGMASAAGNGGNGMAMDGLAAMVKHTVSANEYGGGGGEYGGVECRLVAASEAYEYI